MRDAATWGEEVERRRKVVLFYLICVTLSRWFFWLPFIYFNLPFFSYNIANESAARRNGISLNYRINHLLFSSHRSIHLFNKNIQASKDKFPFQRSSRIKRGGRRKLSRDVPLPRLPPPTLSSPLSFSRNHYILASSWGIERGARQPIGYQPALPPRFRVGQGLACIRRPSKQRSISVSIPLIYPC